MENNLSHYQMANDNTIMQIFDFTQSYQLIEYYISSKKSV